MPPLVFILLAAAAILHVLWNVLLKSSDDPLATAARALGWGLLVATPLVAVAWWSSGRPGISAEAWALAGASAVVELCYFVFLSAAYRRGELSMVYPTARGTAPLLAVLIGLVLLGERLPPAGYAGVALLIGGIWLVRRPAGSGPAVGFALLTGVAIAIYSAIDRLGVLAASPWLYGWALWLFTFILLRAWVRLLEVVRRPVPAGRPPPAPPDGGHGRTTAGRDLVVGAAMVGAWFLVLLALSLAPLAAVAPLRESAIVLAAGWGVLRMGEREGAPLRVVGALAVATGVVLVALP